MLPKTLQRYLLRRWSVPFLGALLFYGGLILAQQLVALSKEIFAQGAPVRWIFPLLATTLPETFAMVLPMAAVLGGLMGNQQLSESSEMVAAQGLGVGGRVLVRPWLILALLILAVGSLNAHLAVPWASRIQEGMKSEMLEEAKSRFLRPGAPPWFPPDSPQHALWMAPDGCVHVLESNPEFVQHLVAKRMSWAQQNKDVENSSLGVQLEDITGTLYQRAEARVVHLRQQSQTLRFDFARSTSILPPTPVRYLGTREVFRHGGVAGWVELSRRVTLPIAGAALLLLGIAFGLGHPRFQRGGAILKSIAVILAYYLLLKITEGLASAKSPRTFVLMFLPPWVFLGVGVWLFRRRLHPHHSHPGFFAPLGRAWKACVTAAGMAWSRVASRDRLASRHSREHHALGKWTRRLWWRNWGAVMGTFLTLFALVEYANMAASISKHHTSLWVFLRYLFWALPPFLAVVLPLAFLLGAVMAFAEVSMSREWGALKAGGVSLVQWIGVAAPAWGLVLGGTLVLQVFLAPVAARESRVVSRQILHKSDKRPATKPWMHLGGTGVVWHLEGKERWGFPLKDPGTAPAILHWKLEDLRARALAWDRETLVPGPEAEDLFPDRALRVSDKAEHATTLDLFHWQRWAPDPERATLLWQRLLGWLAGPILLFAALSRAFPSPRNGRGQSLGYALVLGLFFLGAQALFSGAAKAGELPACWGVLAPMALVFSLGLLSLHRLRT